MKNIHKHILLIATFFILDWLPEIIIFCSYQRPDILTLNIINDTAKAAVILLLFLILYLKYSPPVKGVIFTAFFTVFHLFFISFIYPSAVNWYVMRGFEFIRYITILYFLCCIAKQIPLKIYFSRYLWFVTTFAYIVNLLYIIEYKFIFRHKDNLPADVYSIGLLVLLFWILFKYHKWYKLIKLEAPVNDTDVFLIIRKPLTKKSFIQYLRIVFIPEGIAFSLYHNHKWTGFKKDEGVSVISDWTPSESNKKNNWFINCGHSPELLKVFNSRAGFKYKKGFLKFGKQNCIDVFLRPVMSCNSKINFLSFI